MHLEKTKGLQKKDRRFKFLFVLVAAFIVRNECMAQSENYKKKKDSALKTTSPFELIAAHQKKDVVLEYEDKELMVFEPVSKQAPVHLLIVPKKRITTLNEAGTDNQNMLGKMMLLAKEMARKKGIDQTGYRLALNTNENAGQSVFHIHLHLLGGTKLGPMMDQTFRNNLTANPDTDKQQIEHLDTLLVADSQHVLVHACTPCHEGWTAHVCTPATIQGRNAASKFAARQHQTLLLMFICLQLSLR